MASMLGNFMAIFFFLLVIVGMIAGTIFWAFMIVECATKESDTGNTKIVWIIILVFTHLVGALLYYFVRRPERQREWRRAAHS
jgi:heme/copper-type cytochrome/quinol oxidase subunit 2